MRFVPFLRSCISCAITMMAILAGATTAPLRAQTAFTPNPAETSCVISGVTYTTPLDCTIIRAKQAASATGQPQVLQLGAGVYLTNIGFQFTYGDQPIILQGPGSSAFGGGALIRANAYIPTAMYYLPYLPSSPFVSFWSDINIQGVSFDGNNLANMCWDLAAIRTSQLSNLTCTGATSPQTWARVGSLWTIYGGPVPQDGYDGHSFQVHMSNIFIFHNGVPATNGAGSGALVSSQVNGDGGFGFSVLDPGIYRRYEGGLTVPGLIKGLQCASMPILVGNLSLVDASIHSYTLGSVTVVSPGSGCRGTPSLSFPDIANTRYGMEIYATDSFVDDLTITAVGTVAGLDTRGSFATVFNRYHAVNVTDGADLWGGETFNDAETDSIYDYGFNFKYATQITPISINHTFNVPQGGQAFFNSKSYNYPEGIEYVTVDGQLCMDGSASGDCSASSSSAANLTATNLNVTNLTFLNVAAPLPAEGIIYPTASLTPVVGTDAPINTIALPQGFSSTVGGCIKLRADAAWTWTTAGNIVSPGQATVGRLYEACWSGKLWTIN